MPEALYAKCGNCDVEFPSPVQMDRASLQQSTMEGHQALCPSCGEPVLISKDTLFFKPQA